MNVTAAAPLESARPRDTGVPVFVIASGKGGVGKSTLSVLAAAAFARANQRVLIVDGSLNQGNLHLLLGVLPQGTLEQFLAGDIQVRDLVVPVRANLSLVPSDIGTQAVHALSAVERARLYHRITAVYAEYDTVVVDAGPGIEGAIRTATVGRPRVVAVTTPEPAALSDTCALIKLMHLQAPGLEMDIWLNRANHTGDAQLAADRLRTAARRLLGRPVGIIGPCFDLAEIREAARIPGGLLDLHVPTVTHALTQPARQGATA